MSAITMIASQREFYNKRIEEHRRLLRLALCPDRDCREDSTARNSGDDRFELAECPFCRDRHKAINEDLG